MAGTTGDSVLIFGTGPADGVGGAVAQRFAREGLHVIAAGRRPEKIADTVAAIDAAGGSAEALTVDVTEAAQIDAAFAHAAARQRDIAAVVFNAGYNWPIKFAELSPEEFEEFWRIGCFGAFLVAKQAMPLLVAQGHGSALFTGASASMRGRPNFAHFAAAKAGLRNLVQALAREYGPQGVHVAHIVIDGLVAGDRVKQLAPDYLESLGPDGGLQPTAIAENFWSLHCQPRTAWTHELDVRPFKENW